MDNIIKWILEGDISIQYLTHRDLLNSSEDLLKELQKRIETEGFGAKFLSLQKENGQWGEYYYQSKWTSTHYTLLDMKNIGIAQTCEKCQKIIEQAFDECMLKNGDINYAKTEMKGDICRWDDFKLLFIFHKQRQKNKQTCKIFTIQPKGRRWIYNVSRI